MLKAYLKDQNYYYPSSEMYNGGDYVLDGKLMKKFYDEGGAFNADNLKDSENNRIHVQGYNDGALNINVYGKVKSTTEIKSNGSVFTTSSDFFKGGSGKFLFSNGDVYEGNFKEHARKGIGKYTWADGSTYEGEFKDNKHHRDGKLTKIDGKYMLGTFKENNPKKVKYFDIQNQEITLDQYNTAVQSGFARVDYSNQSFYEGNFVNGKPNGKGFMTYEMEPHTTASGLMANAAEKAS